MNLHITPSFNIDRLCKTASVLLFLVSYWENTLLELTDIMITLFLESKAKNTGKCYTFKGIHTPFNACLGCCHKDLFKQ